MSGESFVSWFKQQGWSTKQVYEIRTDEILNANGWENLKPTKHNECGQTKHYDISDQECQ